MAFPFGSNPGGGGFLNNGYLPMPGGLGGRSLMMERIKKILEAKRRKQAAQAGGSGGGSGNGAATAKSIMDGIGSIAKALGGGKGAGGSSGGGGASGGGRAGGGG